MLRALLPPRCLRPPRPPPLPRRRLGGSGGGAGRGSGLPLWQRGLVVGAVGGCAGGAWLYLREEKGRRARARREAALRGLGLGPPPELELQDHRGRRRLWGDFRGLWVLLYFGFTHCPDVCPEELGKLSQVLRLLEEEEGAGAGSEPPLLPLFVTLDPQRDDAGALGRFLGDFHPRMLGLTGTPQAVAAAASAFRVYSRLGPPDEDGDYLVDHSIRTHLLGPDGTLLDCYGPAATPGDIARSVRRHMESYSPPENPP
ncbi:LOW QUALITY PROTEIN: protein SCO2 homolog, mitochondrial [Calypte anna]|uniref:LOW QUALITY PROTEIN: protein SCO2 homolog, mitochondrial n=1 Tax=Calypte anna TaxID=9244 RepID=UPI0011C3B40E|nr:LOW QUALITY PROTEIN: protein SCO2 homolog, mitochondrial [Calypte anna]